MSKHKSFFFLVAIALVAAFNACTEKESDLGLELQDPSTIYNGVADTAFGIAYMVLDDSLLTTGLNSVVIGSGDDDNIATTVASFYSNVSTPNEASITFDESYIIDSVVLSLAISNIDVMSADSAGSQDLHFVITQLSQRLCKDSAYYSTTDVGLGSTLFFDDVVSVQRGDTMVARLKLTSAFSDLIANHTFASSDEFEEAVKGMHIKLASSTSSRNYVTINLAASNTRITVYYRSGDNDTPRSYDLAFGSTVTHYSRFEKNFKGDCTTFNTNPSDSVRQASMYLSPLGGMNIRFNIDDYIRQFHQDHPMAIIHYAELILPVNETEAPDERPETLAAIKMYENGVVANIPDMYDPYTYSGFDGTYDATNKCYRMRITQHLQKLVKEGRDRGTLIVINGRRTSWQHTVINGDQTANPIRIQLVYSE